MEEQQQQQYLLKWNQHFESMYSVFSSLHKKDSLTDVVIASAEGWTCRSHKFILSACSMYFNNIFETHSDTYPLVILKDVSYEDFQSLLEFMYKGQVNIGQHQMETFMKAAESLKIKGLMNANAIRQKQAELSCATINPLSGRSTPSAIKTEKLVGLQPQNMDSVMSSLENPLALNRKLAKQERLEEHMFQMNKRKKLKRDMGNGERAESSSPEDLTRSFVTAATITPVTSASTLVRNIQRVKDFQRFQELQRVQDLTKITREHALQSQINPDSITSEMQLKNLQFNRELHYLKEQNGLNHNFQTPSLTPSHVKAAQEALARVNLMREQQTPARNLLPPQLTSPLGENLVKELMNAGRVLPHPPELRLLNLPRDNSYEQLTSPTERTAKPELPAESDFITVDDEPPEDLSMNSKKTKETPDKDSDQSDLDRSKNSSEHNKSKDKISSPESDRKTSSPAASTDKDSVQTGSKSPIGSHNETDAETDDEDVSLSIKDDRIETVAGPSTSNAQDPPPSGFPGSIWPPYPPQIGTMPNFEEQANQRFWKNSLKSSILGPYLSSPLPPPLSSSPHTNLSPPFPGLYGSNGPQFCNSTPGPQQNWPTGTPSHRLPVPSLLRTNECTRCGRLYKTRKGLKHHVKNECGVEPRFECSHCDWKFKQKAHLLRHMARKHTSS